MNGISCSPNPPIGGATSFCYLTRERHLHRPTSTLALGWLGLILLTIRNTLHASAGASWIMLLSGHTKTDSLVRKERICPAPAVRLSRAITIYCPGVRDSSTLLEHILMVQCQSRWLRCQISSRRTRWASPSDLHCPTWALVEYYPPFCQSMVMLASSSW